MQQRFESKIIKPRIPKGLKVDSTPSYQKFKQRGYRILPKLVVRFKDTSNIDQSLSSKSTRKMMFTKIFKKAKFIRSLDLSNFLVTDQSFYASKSLYIAKRLSSTLMLSLYDFREWKNGYKGVVASWPKYLKRLRSFSYHVELQRFQNNGFHNMNLPTLPDEISLATDFLRYVYGLKEIEVIYPHSKYASYVGGIWKFKRYPSLIERISLDQAVCKKDTLKTSLAHLKRLRGLVIYFVYNTSVLLVKSAISLISELSQLEVLNINFVENFEIDDMACAAMKKLVNLKQVKLRLSVEKHFKNLQILEALEDCSLKVFCLRVITRDEKDIESITRFLKRKKKREYLECLKVHITKTTLLESSDGLMELINTIDNLPKLTSLMLSHKVSFVVKTARETILPELDLSFKNLFSKPVPMKRFKIALNQFRFSNKGLMTILGSLEKCSSTIEKVTIDIAKYSLKTKAEVSSMLDFMRSLKNIRSLKLFGLGVPTRQFFSELVDVVCTLKYLRILYIGEVSAKVTQATFVEGVEKVLLKNGIEKFICETSADFKKALAKKTKASPPDIDLEKIKKSNPFLKDKPPAPIYAPEDRDKMWKVINS